MKVLLLGTPGAGKDTQTQFITATFDIPQISTGGMLRAAIKAGAPLGLKAKKITGEDDLMRDDIIIGMVKERIAQDDCKNGFLFSGFPRTPARTEAVVEAGVDLDAVVEIGIPDSVIIDHVSGHRVHLASSRTYHVTYDPPKVGGKDSVTDEDLTQHGDDREETAKKRPAVCHEQTEVLVDFHNELEGEHVPKYIEVGGTQPVETVKAEVLGALGK